MLFFIPQSWADRALLEDRIEIVGAIMTVRADGKTYELEEAVRVLDVEDGTDANGVIGKVLTRTELATRGGETIEESLLLGETAYRVQPGFVARFTGTGAPVSTLFHKGGGGV